MAGGTTRSRGAQQRGQALLAGAALLVALLSAGLWAYYHWGTPPNFEVDLPLAPGRELRVTIWMPGPDYLPRDYNHVMLQPTDDPLTVMIWYNQVQAARIRPLAAIELPAWPLLAMAVAGGSAAWVLRRRGR